jgi:F-type H+-transporting ATPase subunit delta
VKKREPVSKLYAKALFELSKESKQVESVQRSFEDLIHVTREQPDLSTALEAFMFPVADRQKLAAEVATKLELAPLLTRLLDLLISKNRIQILEGVYQAFQEYVDESKNTVRGTVTTVEPLSDSEKAGLSKAFAQRFKKEVVLDSAIDKTILGGLVVNIQGLTFDGSLKTTIRRLRENLERQSI